MRYDVIVFDLGDTLLGREPDDTAIMADRLAQAGMPVTVAQAGRMAAAVQSAALAQVDREQRGAARMDNAVFETMLDMAMLRCVVGEEAIPEALAAYQATPRPPQGPCVMEGVHNLLDILKAQGYRLAIVSNYNAQMADFLRAQGLHDYFEAIIISEIVGFEKPDVRIMHAALDALQADAARCLYVGDHPFDLVCAHGAGMDFAWVAPSDQVMPTFIDGTEEYRVDRAVDLPALLSAFTREFPPCCPGSSCAPQCALESAP